MKKLLLKEFLFLAVTSLLGMAKSAAQGVSLTTTGAAYTQSFNTLSNTAGSTTNNLTITGWFMTESGGGARDNEQYAVDTGGSNTGDTYSYGSAAATDRALGELRSGTLIPLFGAAFTNNTGSTLTSLAIAYTGEQWRLGTADRTDQLNFEYSTNATDLVTGNWTSVSQLNFVTPNTATIGPKDGNAAGNRTSLSHTITGLSISNGASFWIRFNDTDASGADDGLAVDDFSLTPNPIGSPSLSINDVTLNEGNAGTTSFTFTVSLSQPAGAGGVTFDIATADGTAISPGDYTSKSLTSQTIPAGSSTYNFTVLVNGDLSVEPNETFFVNVTNVTGANVTDAQGQGTIVTDDVSISLIHDVQGPGAATPIPGSTVIIEGIVTRLFPSSTGLQGFYVQEEDVDIDADPATSEGIFVYDPAGIFAGSVGDQVQVTGTVAEYVSSSGGVTSSLTQLNSLVSITVLSVSNQIPAPTTVKLPVANVSDLERYEGMLVEMSATEGNLTVTDNFQLGRFGQVVLSSTGATDVAGTDARLDQYTQFNAPSVQGYADYLAETAKRRIILDDGSAASNPATILFGRGGQPLSASNTLRAGDEIGLITAILDERFEGYRLQTNTSLNFVAANPRPATPPDVQGSLRVSGFNLLNYFNGDGMGGGFPTSRGADTQAEFTRQRDKTIRAIVESGVDIFVFNELENDGFDANSAIQDLVNGANAATAPGTYAFINPGTVTATDEITVGMIYKPAKVTPVGAAAVIPNGFGNGAFDQVGRKPLAQTFEEIATKARFTVVGNHWKSKGSGTEGVGDADTGDGQGQFNGTRTRQAQDLANWLSTNPTGTNDPDYLILGDLNSYAMEDPLTALANAGYTNLVPNTSYSYVFGGFVGSLDHAFGSSSLTTQVASATKWHINADEPIVLDYNTEFKSNSQISSLYNADQYRTSDHDPVIVGLSLTPVADLSLDATVTNVLCNGGATGAIDLTVTGGEGSYTFEWSNGAQTEDLSGLAAGKYTVVVRDQRGLSAELASVVGEPTALALGSPTVGNVSCNGTSTGSINILASGGTIPYTYTLGNIQNSDGRFSGLSASTYSVTVTDAKGCTSTSSNITISQPAAISLQVSGNTSVTYGYGSSCTTLTANASGGTPGFTYAWNNGTQGPTLNVCPTQTTTYTVTATDANGCTASRQVTVYVSDVRCGNQGQNVTICYYGTTQCVNEKTAKNYLKLGATLGACNTGNTRISYEDEPATLPLQLSLTAYPNPAQDVTTVKVLAPTAGMATFQVLDVAGLARQTKQQKMTRGSNDVEFRLGALPAGIYLIRAVDALNHQATVRVSKQ